VNSVLPVVQFSCVVHLSRVEALNGVTIITLLLGVVVVVVVVVVVGSLSEVVITLPPIASKERKCYFLRSIGN
jgi:hypothetical protein